MAASLKRVAPYGVLAEFESPKQIYHACEQVRDAGFQRWDAHTPFPVHGLDRAMGLRRSKLPFIVLAMALTGGIAGMSIQWWTSVVAQPLVIAGKPLFSWPAFIPVTFELTVLFGAFGALFGMLGLNKLPQLYHALFRSERFERVTDDRFFISIEATDPRFDAVETTTFLRKLGATHVEIIDN